MGKITIEVEINTFGTMGHPTVCHVGFEIELPFYLWHLGDGIGWFKLYSGVPKVFISTSIVIFPIPYASRTTANEKNWKVFEIWVPSKPIEDLQYSDSNTYIINYKNFHFWVI